MLSALLTALVMSPAAAAAMKHFLAPRAGPVFWFAPGFSASMPTSADEQSISLKCLWQYLTILLADIRVFGNRSIPAVESSPLTLKGLKANYCFLYRTREICLFPDLQAAKNSLSRRNKSPPIFAFQKDFQKIMAKVSTISAAVVEKNQLFFTFLSIFPTHYLGIVHR